MPLYMQAAAGNYREYPDRASFDVSGTFSFAIWVRLHATPAGDDCIVMRGSSSIATGEWRLRVSSGGTFWVFELGTGSGTQSRTSSITPVGVWVHICGTYNSSGNIILYKDGVSASSTAAAGTMGALAVGIRLAEDLAGANHADCSLAHFGVWNVELSADAVFAMWACGRPPQMINPDGLILADTLEYDSIDTVGYVRGTNAGNVQSVPRTEPRQQGALVSPNFWLPSPRRAAASGTGGGHLAGRGRLVGYGRLAGSGRLL